MHLNRRILRTWGLSALALLIVTWIVVIFARSDIRWDQVVHYLTVPQILEGIQITLLLTVVSMTLGILIGVVFALMRVSDAPVLIWISSGYIWLFRGIPLLVLIIFCFNLAIFVPRIGIGAFSLSTNDVMSAFVAGVIALSLHESAHMAEIIRGGIQAINTGQIEAARALGISSKSTFRRIVLPQAMRVVIPATGNQTIGMLKATSLVSVIGVSDLLTQAQVIYNRNYQIMELLFTATIWYLVLTAILSGLQHLVERWVFTRRNRRAGQREREIDALRLATVTPTPSAET